MALPMKRCITFSEHLILRSRCINSCIPVLSWQRHYSSDEVDPPKKQRPHIEAPQFPDEFSPNQPKGKIYDKKPFRLELKANKKYAWCACGHSHTQPLCDGTHKTLWGTAEKKTMPKWQPHRFTVEESREYWLCNCKQTDSRPFCDGTHKQPHIQAAVKS